MVEIVAATEDHALDLALTMRPEDVAEIEASGGYTPLGALLAGLDASSLVRALLIDGQVAAIYGVTPLSVMTGTGLVWLLGSTVIDRNRRAFIRASRREMRTLSALFPVLVNAVDARYTRAIRWVKWLGFRVDEARPFGVAGLPFHPIRMEVRGV